MFWFFGKLRAWAAEALLYIVGIPALLICVVLVWLFGVELDPPYDDGCMDAVKDQDDRGGVAQMTPKPLRTSKLQFWDEWVRLGRPPMVLIRLGTSANG